MEYDSIVYMDSIRWTWQQVAGAEGYKYNFDDDYETSIDLGNVCTVKYEQALDSSSTYKIYVWSYNSCGVSDVNRLYASTPAREVTDAEYDIATTGEENLRIL